MLPIIKTEANRVDNRIWTDFGWNKILYRGLQVALAGVDDLLENVSHVNKISKIVSKQFKHNLMLFLMVAALGSQRSVNMKYVNKRLNELKQKKELYLNNTHYGRDREFLDVINDRINFFERVRIQNSNGNNNDINNNNKNKDNGNNNDINNNNKNKDNDINNKNKGNDINNESKDDDFIDLTNYKVTNILIIFIIIVGISILFIKNKTVRKVSFLQNEQEIPLKNDEMFKNVSE